MISASALAISFVVAYVCGAPSNHPSVTLPGHTIAAGFVCARSTHICLPNLCPEVQIHAHA